MAWPHSPITHRQPFVIPWASGASVPTPELGLEIRQARLIHTHVDFETPERIRQRVWHGRVPKLFVILQSRMVSNGKAALTLRAFADIPASKWRMVPIDSEFVLFTAQD